MAIEYPYNIDCPHCKVSIVLDKETRECSNCFGCVGCEQHVCYYCKQLIILEPPRHLQKNRFNSKELL